MRWILLMLLTALTACVRQGSTLDDVEGKMESVVGSVALGDRSGFTFEPLYQADWFLLVPAKATPAMFEDAGLGDALQPVPPELLGRPEPLMATLDGKKLAVKELPDAFQVTKVMAKRGKNTHGIRFARLIGSHRNHLIEGLD